MKTTKLLIAIMVLILLMLGATIYMLRFVLPNLPSDNYAEYVQTETVEQGEPVEEEIEKAETVEENAKEKVEIAFTLQDDEDYGENVLIASIDNSIIIDLRYATENNFTGKVIYPKKTALIAPKTGEKLKTANDLLKEQGYVLKIWDAYRPIEAQQKLWDAVPDPKFVSNPKYACQHNLGISVDVTLCDLDGNEQEMPTPFDEFTSKASPNSKAMTPKARQNLDILQGAMLEAGFKTITSEWWHFDDKGEK